MADTYLSETVATIEIGMGPVIYSQGSAEIGRVVDFGIKVGAKYYSVMEDGVQQIKAMIETEEGPGTVSLTFDTILPIASIRGEKSTIVIKQAKPKATNKMWKMTATTAVVNPQDVKGKRNAEPTQTTLEVTPIGGWTFDEDDTLA